MIALIVALAFIAAVLLTFGGFQLAFVISDKRAEVWHPDYEAVDLDPVLAKASPLDGNDYRLLYNQTGLTKKGIDRALSHGSDGVEKIKAIQNSYFTERTVRQNYFAPLICTDHIYDTAEPIFLEDGDILVTSSTHFSSFRVGHAALVADGANYTIFQATQVGDESGFVDVGNFTNRINFMVLRLKDEVADNELRAKIVEYAVTNLIGKPYNPFCGIITNKNKCDQTMCSHVVWYAFKQFGIDLDSTGGAVVSPRDIARSPYLELVQVFGFNPQKLW